MIHTSAQPCVLPLTTLGQTDAEQIWDDELTNPLGVAAGFDKDGEAIDGASSRPSTGHYIRHHRSL